jgi:hypothetical protein
MAHLAACWHRIKSAVWRDASRGGIAKKSQRRKLKIMA